MKLSETIASVTGRSCGQVMWRKRCHAVAPSEAAASCYDRVYASPRPELFLKATPHRVSGPGQPLRIRRDAHWNVPEPELALAINSRMELVGCTVGNDMSSRDIEGENPLYLPQAKCYDRARSLGPVITLADSTPPLLQIMGKGRKAAKTRSIAFGFQMVLGTLVNAILNDPGPLSIHDDEMEIRLSNCLLLLLEVEMTATSPKASLKASGRNAGRRRK